MRDNGDKDCLNEVPSELDLGGKGRYNKLSQGNNIAEQDKSVKTYDNVVNRNFSTPKWRHDKLITSYRQKYRQKIYGGC